MVGEDVADGLPPPEEGSPGRSSGKRTRNRTTADKCLGAAGGVLITKQESKIWEMGGGLRQMGVAVRSMMGGTEVEHGRAASGFTWRLTPGPTTGPGIIRRTFVQIFPAQPPSS